MSSRASDLVRSRMAARLAASLSIEELADLAAAHCCSTTQARNDIDAVLAARTPVPEWVVSDVLTHEDRAAQILALCHYQTAPPCVCKAWRTAWKDTADQRRWLRPATLPKPSNRASKLPPNADSMMTSVHGDRLIAGGQTRQNGYQLRMYDRDMTMRHNLDRLLAGWSAVGSPTGSPTMASSSEGLYIYAGTHLRRYDLGSFDLMAERNMLDLHFSVHVIAPAAKNLLFIGGWQERVLALDAHTLEVRYQFPTTGYVHAMVAVGDELILSCHVNDGILLVYSLAGECRRETQGAWGSPKHLQLINDQLYLVEWTGEEEDSDGSGSDSSSSSEHAPDGRRIFVLSPGGDETLQVYEMPNGDVIDDVALLGDKLIVKLWRTSLSTVSEKAVVLMALTGL